MRTLTARGIEWTKLSALRDRRDGQDMIEYALLAAFIAVAVAAFFPTDIAPNVSTVFSKIVNVLSQSPG